MTRRESSLFDFGKVIDRILVERHFSDFTQGDFRVRPNFSQIEDIPTEFLGLFGTEDLYVNSPTWEIARVNLIEKILSCIVGIFSTQMTCCVVVEGLDALVDDEGELSVVKVA